MCRKLIFLMVLVVVVSSVGSAATIHWTALGKDKLWSNPANWEGNKVPTIADEAYIDVPAAAAPNGPVIVDGIDAKALGLGCEVAGDPTMTMTGGTLQIAEWVWWGDGDGCHGTFYMNGGTITTGAEFELGWGGGEGTWIMTGGTVNAQELVIPTDTGHAGQLYLHGGTFNVGSDGLSMTAVGLIDITEGTLVLEGDERTKVNTLIAAKQITAYGGAGTFVLDFGKRNPGRTTLTAAAPIVTDDLVIYYSFDEVTGVVADGSGKGHDGTVVGDVTANANGVRGRAAKFGTSGSPGYLDLGGPTFDSKDIPTSAFTLAAWTKVDGTSNQNAIFNARASDGTWLVHPEIRTGDNDYRFTVRKYGSVTIGNINGGTLGYKRPEGTPVANEWVHVAMSYSKADAQAVVYVNGKVVAQVAPSESADMAGDWGLGARVGYNIDNARHFNGLMDEFYMFKRALSQNEIESLIAMPAVTGDLVIYYNYDEVTGVVADGSGKGHDGTVVGDVTDAAGKIGRAAKFGTSGSPGYLDLGGPTFDSSDIPTSAFTLAAWAKVDGTSNQNAIFNARASDNTWLIHPEIRIGDNDYRLTVRKYGSVTIVNINGGTPGYKRPEGTPVANEWVHVAMTYSKADAWAILYVNGQVVAEVAPTEAADMAGDWGLGARVGYNIDNARHFSGLMDEFYMFKRALSQYEVQCLYSAGFATAHTPNPSDCAVDVASDTNLSWVAGDPSFWHNVYLGTNPAALVRVSTAQAATTYDPPDVLDLGKTYYWRVDEVPNISDVNEVIKGTVWTFTVRLCILVDDFESYGNAVTPGPPPPAGSRIWYTWKDGEGWTVPSVTPGNGTGSVTGLSGDIVHGGKQSLTYSYDNDGTNALGTSGKKYYSEIGADTANLAVGGDWTKQGVKALTLWFYGDPGNDANATEQMYVKLDGVKVVYDGNMNNVKDPSWHEWNIDLARFGLNMQNVTQICIGFGDENNTTPAGSGTVYFDDIRLYPPRCISPGTYPGDINGDCFVNSQDLDLMTADWLKCDYTVLPHAPAVGAGGWWKFDETSGLYAYDSSGNDLKGLLFNGPVWVTGYIGGALRFDGIDDYVDVLNDPKLNPSSAITVVAWVKPSAWTGNNRILQKGVSDNQYRLLRENDVFKWHLASVVGGLSSVDTVPAVGEWHHVAGTYDGSKMRIYYDGSIVAETPASGQILATADRLYIGTKNDTAPSGDHFEGLIDDVRIYSYGLSQAEILSVAGLSGAYVPLTVPGNLADPEPENHRCVNFVDYAILADDWLAENLFP